MFIFWDFCQQLFALVGFIELFMRFCTFANFLLLYTRLGDFFGKLLRQEADSIYYTYTYKGTQIVGIVEMCLDIGQENIGS